MKDREMIQVIAEQLKNEFPGHIPDLLGKAERLYNIMKLEKSLLEMEEDKKSEQIGRIREELDGLFKT